jgi:dTDP-4-amino-4,6-dideoxygalactose transaminase
LNPATRAICAVHYGGAAPDVAELTHLCAESGITLIEDNAHGLYGTHRGRPLGTFGSMSTLSFHETKNISSGEGGALVLNDASLVERAETLREKGTNRSRFFRGEVDKYTWVDLGSSYLCNEITAASLFTQMNHRTTIQGRRARAWFAYEEAFRVWMPRVGAVPHTIGDGNPFHLFAFLLPSLEIRTRFLEFCRDRGVHAVFHYVPLDSSPMGLRLGGGRDACPVTAHVSDRVVRLPLFSDIRDEEIAHVIEVVSSFGVSSPGVSSPGVSSPGVSSLGL